MPLAFHRATRKRTRSPCIYGYFPTVRPAWHGWEREPRTSRSPRRVRALPLGHTARCREDQPPMTTTTPSDQTPAARQSRRPLSALDTAYTGVFPGRADQVGRARRQVARYLASCPAADDALIVLTELATNAVLHSRSGHDFFTVRAELTGHHARLVVEDAGGTWQQPDPAGTDGGRGLQIVAAIAEAWGIDGDDRGRAVW